MQQNLNDSLVTRAGACLESLWRLATHWAPEPVDPPELHPHFSDLPAPTRIIESARFQLAMLEFNLSPNGALQEWRRFWIRLALIVCIPTVAIIPMVAALGYLFGILLDLLVKALSCLAALAAIIFIGLLLTKKK